MADNDAQLELKKRARRRLIGAIALCLAAAVFLPMVMDSEPRPTGNDLQIRIPNQEGSTFTSRMINTAPAGSAPQSAAQSAPQPVVVPVDPEPALSVVNNTLTPVAPSAPASPGSAPRSAPTHASSSAASSPSAQARSSSAASSASKSAPGSAASAEARARALLEQGNEPAQRFFVQVGVYRDADNAKSVAAKIKQQGMVPSLEKIADKTRVRVGPFKTRAAADAALAKLKHANLSGTVTGK
ncbi:SPOR domain-containing protein [Uliginosibacterium sediminicola]|uniref:SPOR domain-containing protein n=1 Tax=Uliginosibacterium sediminicola TaxID=2024550 RepID=A0ABU9Z0K0_9RHOO